jgi:1,4-dihydroxy-2-naphthoate polyprenyltransferase
VLGHRRTLFAFVRLTRPLFLYGGFAGVALGVAVAASAGHRINVVPYVWAQILVTAYHLMVHYSNDYFDRGGDVDARPTAWSGGSGVLASGELSANVALVAALTCGAIGLLATIRFALLGNAAVAALGIAIAVLAWSYSAPPARLCARGLGELDTSLVVAVLVPAVGYAAFTGAVDVRILSSVFPCALAMFAMMLSVELPDADADYLSGKCTLVVRWGAARTWPVVAAFASTAAATAAAVAVKHAGFAAGLLLVPAIVAAVAIVRCAAVDPRAAAGAFWGVALYATTVTGLAVTFVIRAIG